MSKYLADRKITISVEGAPRVGKTLFVNDFMLPILECAGLTYRGPLEMTQLYYLYKTENSKHKKFVDKVIEYLMKKLIGLYIKRSKVDYPQFKIALETKTIKKVAQ